MRKRLFIMILALAMALTLLPVTAMAVEDDFTIEGGILTKYNGPGGEVTIPDGVTSIGEYAFEGCTSLTSVTIGNGVTSIGNGAFRGCSELISVTIGNGVTSIGNYAFYVCQKLTSVEIPSDVTSIGDFAFGSCYSLTSVTIPDGVTSIGQNAFSYCSGLTSVEIPSGVTSIGDYAFQNCTSLTNVVIPSGVTSIGYSMFSNCTSLTSVEIPGSVTSVGGYAFQNCTGLTDVYCWGSESSVKIGNNAMPSSTNVWYPGEARIVCSDPQSVKLIDGTPGVSVYIISDRPFAPFMLRTSMYNFIVNEVETGLTLVNVNLDGNNMMRLDFRGTPNGGKITGTIASAAFAGPEDFTSAAPFEVEMPGDAGGTEPQTITYIVAHEYYVNGAKFAETRVDRTEKRVGDVVRDEDIGKIYVYGNETYTYTSTTPALPYTLVEGENIITLRYDRAVGNKIIVTWTMGIEDDDKVIKWEILDKDITDEQLNDYYPPDPELEGYMFKEWIKVGPDENNIRIHAQWEVEPVDDSATGSLTITNLVSGGGAGAGSKTFTFTVTGQNGYSSTVSITGAGSITITGLTAGAYTVTGNTAAAAIAGYDLVSGIQGTVIVLAPGTASVTAVNIYSPASGSTSGSGTGSGSSGSSVSTDAVTKPAGTPEVPELGHSPIQDGAIRADREEIPDWIDRLNLPGYALTFYNMMAGNTLDSLAGNAGGRKKGIFEIEQNFALPEPAGSGTAQVDQIEVVEFSMMDMYADPQGTIQSTIFQDERFYRVSADAGDRSVDFAKLEMGSVVKNSSFNGVFVTKIPYDSEYDSKKKEACEYIAAVFQAFDRDHPEVFWLSGKCKARIMVAANPATGVKEAYFFLVLADKDGFTMCAPDWTESGAITGGVARRDAAVEEILKTVTADDTAGKMKQLNKWITEHNQYNTTRDLTTIGNEPHECLAALEGRIGTDGPVCDGYSRALKVLCDRLSIPCVLETGWARPRTYSEKTFHMWNLVQVGGEWYGTDVTWDDPSVLDLVAAISGKENENYLLVGAGTVVNGQTFTQSHMVQNQAAAGGVAFSNGPVMSPVAYSGLSVVEFSDVPYDAYYYDGVLWAVDRGITTGTSATTFSPDAPCTQVQILTFLWRAAGRPAGNGQLPFTLNKGLEYAGDALCWAYQNGMIDGSFDQTALCTRGDALRFIWQTEGSPEVSGSVFTDVPAGADYAQAVTWAAAKRVAAGTSATTFSPDELCSRGQIATFMCRNRT